jgi:hypothetical protein
MTAFVFLVCFAAAWLWYGQAGAMAPWGMTIYTSTALVVLMCGVAWSFAVKHTDTIKIAILLCVNFAFGHFAWTYGGSYQGGVMLHMALHLALAVVLLMWTQSRLGGVVGLLMCANVVWASLELLGAFGPRPRVFTGVYYPDLMAYTSIAAAVLLGRAGGDGGKWSRNWLLTERGRRNEATVGHGLYGAGRFSAGYRSASTSGRMASHSQGGRRSRRD